MQLNDFYWLYSIECIPTGQIYIGQTGQPNPCWRWERHFTELKRGVGPPLFQKTWNDYPDWIHWRFQTKGRIEGKHATNRQEAEFILAIPETQRLNSKKTSTLSLEKHRRVEDLLKKGRRYIDIRDEVGVSMGLISEIAKTSQVGRYRQ